MADDLNLFELDEARLTLLDSNQGARARSTSQAVDLSGPVVVGGRLDLSAEAEAEAVQVGLNYGDAYSEQVLSEAFAIGIGSHQDSSWDVLLQPSDVDGLLKVTTGLGGSIEVPTLDGGRAKVAIPEGTQSGRQCRLKGKGMPVLRSGQRGDLYIEVAVETPVKLSKRQK